MRMKSWFAGLAVAIILQMIAVPVIHAASLGQILGQTAAEWLVTKEIIRQYHYQKYSYLNDMKREVGVNEQPRANDQLKDIAERLLKTVAQREKVEAPPYTFFVNNKKEMNAYCGLGHNITVNIGTFEFFDYNEDELAVVIAHEMGHGQRNHGLNSIDKQVPFMLVHRIYLARNNNTLSGLTSYLFFRQMMAKNATLPGEREADALSFDWATAAGYNPGAGAAAWTKVRAKYGDKQPNFLGELLSPSDHPTQGQRIDYFAKRMTEYSGGQVKVNAGQVYIKDNPVMIPAKTGSLSAEERAYLIAGNLAKAVHNNPVPDPAQVVDGYILMGDMVITTPTEQDEPAETIAERMNEALEL